MVSEYQINAESKRNQNGVLIFRKLARDLTGSGLLHDSAGGDPEN
jgi:hypothetical protein